MMPRTALLLSLLFASPATAAPRRLQSDAPIRCGDCEEWNRPHAPFRIFGNTYFVGVAGLSSLLLVGDSGSILIDGGLPQSVPQIDANIRALGFRTEDIKVLLNGHAHFDHAGGLAALQRFTGARVIAGRAGVRALEQGRPTPDDPQAKLHNNRFPPVANVHGIEDGEVVRVGALAVTAHATPGHTPGSTTWTWRSCEGARCLDLVYADSLTPVSAPGFFFSGHAEQPSIVESFRRSVQTLSRLPCDILIGAHPSVGDLDGKLKRRTARPGLDPFIDPDACRAVAAGAMKALDARVADEVGPKR